MMSVREILNKAAFPSANDNVRRTSQPLYYSRTIAAGQTEYYFFNASLNNIFLANKKLPLSGAEIFIVDGINVQLSNVILGDPLASDLCDMLQLGYLNIKVNGVEYPRFPLLDMLRYNTVLATDATPEVIRYNYQKVMRPMIEPILLNSNANVEFKIVIPASAAAAFDTGTLKLVLHGVQMDKLSDFYYDELKGRDFQQRTATYYNTRPILTGDETTYNFFATANQEPERFSAVFPLSDIINFQVQEIEVFVSQPTGVPINPSSIYDSRISNNLVIKVNSTEFYNSNLQDKLSVVAGVGVIATTTGADTLPFMNIFNFREAHLLKIPLLLPGQSTISATITQPAASLPVTGNITLALRGIETRRVS